MRATEGDSALPYEERVQHPGFPHIGLRIKRETAERLWRMQSARGERIEETFTAAVEALSREMNAGKSNPSSQTIPAPSD